MKIIFDNIIFSLQKSGGISILWQNLLNQIICNSDLASYFIEYPDADHNIFRPDLLIPNDKIYLKSQWLFKIKRYFSPKIKTQEPFIFHSSYYRIANTANAINITTVHDFTYEKFFPKIKRIIHSWQKFKAIRKSDWIVCISENTKRDLLKYLPDIDPSKIRIIYNGVSSDYHPLEYIPYPELKNSILFIGSRINYKNFNYTVECVKQTKYNLLICGTELSDEERIKLDRDLGPKRYSIIKNPNNVELNKIYNSVLCLSYPSSYEGFGIPVIEAQKAACPVLALNKSSIPEIIGNGYPIMENLSQIEFDRLIHLFEYAETRKKIINIGQTNAKRFSWKKMAEEYLSLYQEIEQTIKHNPN